MPRSRPVCDPGPDILKHGVRAPMIVRKPSPRFNRNRAARQGERRQLSRTDRRHCPADAAERFAALRASLHRGLVDPPEWWPDAQQRLLEAADEYERAFLQFVRWVRSRQGRAA